MTSRIRLASNKQVLDNQNILLSHIHSAQKVYPPLADGITLTSHATPWTLGDKVEVVPVNTITSIFDIHFVNVGAVSANDTYEVVLYKGLSGAETEIGRFRTVRIAVQAATQPSPFNMIPVPANARISAAVASASGNDTLEMAIFYHTY